MRCHGSCSYIHTRAHTPLYRYKFFSNLLDRAQSLKTRRSPSRGYHQIDLIHIKLGFPKYFIMFVGVAKILGVIGILVPGYPRVREWAYAGLFFDLTAATASGIAVEDFIQCSCSCWCSLHRAFYHTSITIRNLQVRRFRSPPCRNYKSSHALLFGVKNKKTLSAFGEHVIQ